MFFTNSYSIYYSPTERKPEFYATVDNSFSSLPTLILDHRRIVFGSSLFKTARAVSLNVYPCSSIFCDFLISSIRGFFPFMFIILSHSPTKHKTAQRRHMLLASHPYITILSHLKDSFIYHIESPSTVVSDHALHRFYRFLSCVVT